MENKTLYIGYYFDETCHKANRSVSLAGKNKMDYISRTMDNIHHNVEIVSASGVIGKHSAMSKVDTNRFGIPTRYFMSIGRKNKWLSKFGTAAIKIQLLWYLLVRTHSNTRVVVYHSLGYMKLIDFVKRIKHFKLVLEVEEIYADVSNDDIVREKELTFCKAADAYIFPTCMLSDIVNLDRKPEVIIHGTYCVEPPIESRLFDDDKIHCVYAGTLDPRKGGAAAAAAAAEFLPENYHLHILGFGSNEEMSNIRKLVDSVTAKGHAVVTYDGVLTGQDYIRFIQSCDIGLSTQNPDAAFNATSFPSKILSYMANGLRVVSIRIPAIETSAIGTYMYYYDVQTPEKIAEAIMSVNTNDIYDGRKVINHLAEEFERNLRNLLG